MDRSATPWVFTSRAGQNSPCAAVYTSKSQNPQIRREFLGNSALTNANPNLNLAKLKAGQKIQIPTAAASASTGLGSREPSNPGKGALSSPGNIHVVKAGETLTQIAKQSHTTVKASQAVNGLKTTRVLVGQKLRLPAHSAA